MSVLTEIIERLKLREDCEIRPPAGLPSVRECLKLPDVLEFYSHCGEASLFGPREKGVIYGAACRFVPPGELVTVRQAIMGEETTGIERKWFAIADVLDGNYIGIDLSIARNGWCYDCFQETYGGAGDTMIIAKSFSELLQQFHVTGESCLWLKDLEGYGDAYDSNP